MLTLIVWLIYDTYLSSTAWENPPEKIGTRDLIAFWGGVQLFFKGGNPYNFDQLFRIQKSALPTLNSEQYFLNPPWSIPLLAPIMLLPFREARCIWLLFNVSSIILASGFILGFQRKIPLIHLALATLLFIPSIMMIWFGQMSHLIYISMIGGCYFYKQRKHLLAGLLFSPLTLKPHLVYLTLLYLVFLVIGNKHWRVIIGFLLALIVLNLTVLTIDGSIFTNYLNLNRTPMIYKSSTLPTVVRMIWASEFGYNPKWPVFLIPLISVLIFGCIIYKNNEKELCFNKVAWYTGLSLLLAPYAWMYDYSLLLVIQLLSLTESFNSSDHFTHKQVFSKFIIALLTLLLVALIPSAMLTNNFNTTKLITIIISGITIISISIYLRAFLNTKYRMTVFLVITTQMLALLTGTLYKELISFIWFPAAMLIIASFSFKSKKCKISKI